MPPEETVKGLLLAAGELAALDARVVDAKEGVDVVHGLRSHVGELLDLGGDVLDLVVIEREAELLDTGLDGVPAGQAVSENKKRESGLWLLGLKSNTHPIET